ncbi:unnamed protein product [Pedinophyceae sp. YPF-701]|nr:unnamed protein product [Pedinophyceae sp. YPF-701]
MMLKRKAEKAAACARSSMTGCASSEEGAPRPAARKAKSHPGWDLTDADVRAFHTDGAHAAWPSGGPRAPGEDAIHACDDALDKRGQREAPQHQRPTSRWAPVYASPTAHFSPPASFTHHNNNKDFDLRKAVLLRCASSRLAPPTIATMVQADALFGDVLASCALEGCQRSAVCVASALEIEQCDARRRSMSWEDEQGLAPPNADPNVL